jgi:mRNA interferase RelE/StbE
MSDEWTWRFTSQARNDFEELERDDQQQIRRKLDEICESPWRDPPDYGEPMQNSPYKKVRVGGFRLSTTFDRDNEDMIIARIKHRGGAYTADD